MGPYDTWQSYRAVNTDCWELIPNGVDGTGTCVYVDTGGIHSEKSPIPGYIHKLMPIKCPYPCLCEWTDNECMTVYILLKSHGHFNY